MPKNTLEERSYQTEAVENILAHFANGKESVMLESPVGSGKTVMGLMVIKALQDQASEKLTVNWVASRRHILEQTARMNEQWFHCDINTVSVFASNPPKADFVVLDEAHHEATQSCLNMYEMTGNSRTLGLSATPMRTDKMRLSFQAQVHCLDIQRLMDMGVLSPYHSRKLPEWNVPLVAHVFCQYSELWGKSLAFFATIQQCLEFQEYLAHAGIVCEVITAKSNRDAQLDAFLEGSVQVIANVSVLTEGFDLPDLQTIFIRDASRLPTIQMLGRGLRKAPAKSHCNIVQSTNAAFQVERIAKPLESYRYLKQHWLSCSGDTEAIHKALEETSLRIEKRKSFAKRKPVSIKTPQVREISLRCM